MNRNLALPLLAALAISAAAPADAQFGKPSKSDQVRLGQQAADEIRKKERILPGYDERVRAVRRIGSRLLASVDSGKDPWQYSFDVIQNKQVNAFALPGGPMFVYTGLLDKVQTEDELAGILGHELTHVRKEHWAYQYRDMQQKSLLLNLGLILFKANRTVADLSSIGLDVLVNMPYSRKHETEADDGGFDMMARAGYNPQGLADVFRILQSHGGGKAPEFLSDHPADAKRIRHIEDKVRSSGRSFGSQVPLPWAER